MKRTRTATEREAGAARTERRTGARLSDSPRSDSERGGLTHDGPLSDVSSNELDSLFEAPLPASSFLGDVYPPDSSSDDFIAALSASEDLESIQLPEEPGVEFSQDNSARQDLELSNQFLSGSDSAFVHLYAKYEVPLLHYCRRMLSSEKMAEDAFQEVWMRIFELRTRGQAGTNGEPQTIRSFRGLLFRSARNYCLNMLRLEDNRSGSSEALPTLQASDESSREIEQEEIRTLITKALSKLPFDQREAFVLHEYSGYSYAQIAEMMNTTEVNVKVRACRARLRLRKLIASWLGLREDDDPANVL